MINIKDLKPEDVGRWVVYTSGDGHKESGKIKSWNDSGIFVVYNLSAQQDRWQDYTAAHTDPEDLGFFDNHPDGEHSFSHLGNCMYCDEVEDAA